MVVEVGQRFTLRDGLHTIGTGVITKLLTRLLPNEVEDLQKSQRTIEKELARKQKLQGN